MTISIAGPQDPSGQATLHAYEPFAPLYDRFTAAYDHERWLGAVERLAVRPRQRGGFAEAPAGRRLESRAGGVSTFGRSSVALVIKRPPFGPTSAPIGAYLFRCRLTAASVGNGTSPSSPPAGFRRRRQPSRRPAAEIPPGRGAFDSGPVRGTYREGSRCHGRRASQLPYQFRD